MPAAPVAMMFRSRLKEFSAEEKLKDEGEVEMDSAPLMALMVVDAAVE
ncbi:hypothetical protein ES705_42570 [subsurface metagenome]